MKIEIEISDGEQTFVCILLCVILIGWVAVLIAS